MGKDTASHSRGRLMAILCVLVLVDGSEGVEKAAVEPFHNSRADVHSDVHWVRSSLSILAQRLSDRTQPQVQLLVARTLVGHLAQAVADRLGVHATEMQSDLPNRSPSQRPTQIDGRQTRTISPTASTCLPVPAAPCAAQGHAQTDSARAPQALRTHHTQRAPLAVVAFRCLSGRGRLVHALSTSLVAMATWSKQGAEEYWA